MRMFTCTALLFALLLDLQSFSQSTSIRLLPQTGHSAAVRGISTNGRGKIAVSLDDQGKVVVWNLQTGLQSTSLEPSVNGLPNTIVLHPYNQEFYFDPGQTVVAYSFAENKVVWQRTCPEAPSTLAIDASGRFLAIGLDREIWILDAATGKVLRKMQDRKKLPYSERVETLLFSFSGDTIFSGHNDGTVRMWDAVKGILLRKKAYQQGNITSLAMNPDGKLLAIADNSENIALWETENWQEIKRIQTNYSFPERIAFHPDQPLILAAWNDGLYVKLGINERQASKGIISAWNFESTEKVWEHEQEGGIMDFSLLLSTNLFLTGDRNWQLLLRRLSDGQIIRELKPQMVSINELICVEEGNVLLQADNSDHLKIWDLHTGKLIKSLPLNKGQRATALAYDIERQLLAIGMDQHLVVYEAPPDFDKIKELFEVEVHATGSVQKIFFVQSKDQLLVSGSNKIDILLRGLELLSKPFQGDPNDILTEILNPDQPRERSSSNSSFLRLIDLKQKNVVAEFADYTGEGSEIALQPNTDFLVMGNEDASITHFDLATDKEVGSISTAHNQPITVGRFSRDGSLIVTGGYDPYFLVWDLAQGQYKKLGNYINSYLLDAAFSPDNQIVAIVTNNLLSIWDLNTDESIYNYIHPRNFVQVTFSPDGKLVIAADEAGELVWSRLDEDSPTYFAAAVGADDYLAYTTEGFYTASKDAALSVAFTDGSRTYTFDQFDVRYNRPDKLLAEIPNADTVLLEAYQKAYEKRLQKLGVSIEGKRSLDIPTLEILASKLQPETSQRNLSFVVKAEDAKVPLSHLHIWVNGVPIYGSRGLTISNGRYFQGEVTIELCTGSNHVEVAVSNSEGNESARESFDIFLSQNNVLPKVYLVGIGVSDYEEKNYNLQYAAKDIEDLSHLFSNLSTKSKEAYYFDTLLIDQEVNRANILQLKNVLLNTQVDDQVILYYAGHGLLDDSLNYYLATHNIDFDNPQVNGLLYKDFESLLDGIPARNKLILIDACHSGEVDKDQWSERKGKDVGRGVFISSDFRGGRPTSGSRIGLQNSFELMKELFVDIRRSTGATVIAASGGNEYAYEGETVNRKKITNGLFTFYLLKGIQQSNADLDKDGKIRVHELQRYVAEEVGSLTNFRQKPVFRIENPLNNWVVWKNE